MVGCACGRWVGAVCLLASWGVAALSLVVRIVLGGGLDFVLSAFRAIGSSGGELNERMIMAI